VPKLVRYREAIAYVVIPQALRESLIRDKYFTAPRLPLAGLLADAPDFDASTEALVSAALRGADVESEQLRSRLAGCGNPRLWKPYSWLGVSEVRWALNQCPHITAHLIDPALQWIPGEIIPQLIASAAGDGRPLHSTLEHPLRQLEDWVKSGRPGTKNSVERRRLTCNAAMAFVESGGDDVVG